jgi:hypothetical protein
LARAVRDATRDLVRQKPSLVHKPFRDPKNPLVGTCYFASEAYWHLAGRPPALTPIRMKDADWGPHWYLEDADGNWIDPTFEQMGRLDRRLFPYEDGKPRPFMTTAPSRRAAAVIAEVLRRDPELGSPSRCR